MGDRVKFWKDRWCGDLPLKLAFPVLYNFAANKEASVESSLICQGAGDRRIWDVRFNRGPNDWEVDVVDEFLCLLASNLPSGTDGDHLKWKLTKNGDFTIRSYYYKLHGSSFLGKAFGRLRHPIVSLSLFGQLHGIGSSREITCGLGVLISSTGALCVAVVVRQWIICCYIVERLIGCGALSLGF